MRAIDADALVKDVRENSESYFADDFAEFWVNRQPTIQPEIVRCKDCKHYRHGLCMKASMCVNKSENGFCDWGERREVTT